MIVLQRLETRVRDGVVRLEDRNHQLALELVVRESREFVGFQGDVVCFVLEEIPDGDGVLPHHANGLEQVLRACGDSLLSLLRIARDGLVLRLQVFDHQLQQDHLLVIRQHGQREILVLQRSGD